MGGEKEGRGPAAWGNRRPCVNDNVKLKCRVHNKLTQTF